VKSKVLSIFRFLDDNSIQYLLLRPLDLEKGFNDVDLAISKTDFNRLIERLKTSEFSAVYQDTNSNASAKLIIDRIVLDVQFYICFLPYKSLVVQKEFPTANVKQEENLIIPNVEEEVLFTFWTLRLFLDKNHPTDFSSFELYRTLFSDKWSKLMDTTFFKNWMITVFGMQNEAACKIMKVFFANGFHLADQAAIEIKSLVFEANSGLAVKHSYDKAKYRILRRMGRYNRTRSLRK